jgi:hypothetical protein
MIIIGDDTTGISSLRDLLSHNFEMKDLGSLNYFLGLKVLSSTDGLLLSQAKYASDLIVKAGLTDNRNETTPLEPNIHFSATDETMLDNPTIYRQLVGSLIYLTVTRPYISYVVHIVSQFMCAPCTTHFGAILWIICYIKGTFFRGLHFSSCNPLVLQAYSDAGWAGDPDHRCSTTSYFNFLGDFLISWQSKKQIMPSRSTT